MTKTSTHKLFGLLAGAVVLMSTVDAEAQYIEERFMLGFSHGLFEFNNETLSTDYSSDDFSASKISLGILPTLLGIDLGYGVSELVVVGTNFQFSYINIDPEGESSLSGTTVSFVPHVDIVFSQGQSARPFIGLLAGLQFASESDGFDDQSLLSFLFGARTGIHFFVVDAVSITPVASFMYGIGSYEDTEIDVDTILVDVFLGLTAWL